MTVRIGAIGVGGMGGMSVQSFQALPGMEVAGIFDLSTERAKAVAAEGQVPVVFGSAEELLASDEVDLVYIGTPPSSHAELSIAAARAGKHIICEKPMALNSAEADAMVAAAAEAGVVNAISHSYVRYEPGHLHLKRLLDDGYVGKVFLVVHTALCDYGVSETPRMPPFYANWLQRRADGGGVVFQYFSHLLDASMMLFGGLDISSCAKLTAVPEKPVPKPGTHQSELYGGTAEIVGTERIDVEDTVVLHGTLAGGGLASMASTWSGYSAPGFRWEVFGSEGTLQLATLPEHMVGFPLELRGGRKGAPLQRLDPPADLQASPTRQSLVQDVVATIDGSRTDEPNYPTFADAAKTQRLLDQLTT